MAEQQARIGVGIIGTGGISRAHVRGYSAFPDACRIVAVCDIDAERAKEAAAQIGDDVAHYDSYESMLQRDDIELVSVCTPPFVHAPAAVAALEAGKHVLVEKPMAASPAECDAMIAAADRAGKLLSVVFQNRWRADWWRAKAVVDKGLLGPLHFGKADCLWWRGRKYYDLWWRGTWEQECGGATINHAIHLIDGFLWLMGDVESVYAEYHALNHAIEVEDTSMALLRFKSGAVGQITSSVSLHHNLDRVEITGESAGMSVPWAIHAMKERPNGFGDRDAERIHEIEGFASQINPPEHEGHANQIADVIDAIRTQRQPLVDGREGRRAVEVITAIYKSASEGTRVTLPLRPDDPFYTTAGLRENVKRLGAAK